MESRFYAVVFDQKITDHEISFMGWFGFFFVFLSLHHSKKINSGILCAVPQII